jgi:hypothetical protein
MPATETLLAALARKSQAKREKDGEDGGLREGDLRLRALADRCEWMRCRRCRVWEGEGVGRGTRLDRGRDWPLGAVRWPPGWTLSALLHVSRSVGIMASTQGGARGWLWCALPWDRGLGCPGARSGMEAGGT